MVPVAVLETATSRLWAECISTSASQANFSKIMAGTARLELA
jgi:hypothetical protein